MNASDIGYQAAANAIDGYLYLHSRNALAGRTFNDVLEEYVAGAFVAVGNTTNARHDVMAGIVEYMHQEGGYSADELQELRRTLNEIWEDTH